ncbi:glucuronate isomerase [Microlunatus sp. GCM10028923]|uniref:glucuronate isomerase n=1 Tax=Microlunatus sp. GCM10028923 TaxID=3273400 RepID=UPI003609FB7E
MTETAAQLLQLDPDRLFPADPAIRALARELYEPVADAPIYSPHGHVDPALLLDNAPFGDPAELLITPDHYVLRLLHATGVTLADLGRGADGTGPRPDGREIWRLLCRNWYVFAGTPVRYWLESQLAEILGVNVRPSEESADRLYDELSELLQSDAFRPRTLFDRFKIKVLATTDDPADDLAAHRALAADPTFTGRVLPTFRPDGYLDPSVVGWPDRLARLAEAAGSATDSYRGLIDALRARRRYFIENGGTATDNGPFDAWGTPLPDAEAERIHAAGLAGTASPADGVAYRRNLTYQLAAMSVDDGLVMQLHPGVHRSHHAPSLARYGTDAGHDLPAVGGYTEPLRRILNDFGTDPNFRLVLFTVDETTFSREIAPLAGFYPSVYAGAPWWFLDTPAAIGRYRAAVTDSAGFYKTSGFIDDTRAFLSIPARHDMSRRTDAVHLAELVATHQLDLAEAHTIAHDLVTTIPTTVFRL